MLGIKGIRYAVRMAPTPQQTQEIREVYSKLMSMHGVPSSPNQPLSGLGEERLLTIDEALEVFKDLKDMESASFDPADVTGPKTSRCQNPPVTNSNTQ